MDKYPKKKFLLLSLVGLMIIGFSFVIFNQYENLSYPDTTKWIPKKPNVILDENNPIKIGILHSQTGTMAISEKSVIDATLLAIEEINQKGGILGRKVVPVLSDGKSDWDVFAYEAERLIVEEKVDVVFGGWTSASRKTMKPIFEEYDHLLFYPVQYEGLEQSPNIVYMGAVPNQQVIPAVDWAIENIGTKFFLVGSDYVFPKSANEIIKNRIHHQGGQIVGEEYKILGDLQFNDVVDKIINSNPDVILNTVNGDSNIALFAELRNRGITSSVITTISFSIAENEISVIGADKMQGDYAVWNYFQSIDSNENLEFVKHFKEKYGENRVTDDPMQAGYTGVYLYAKAVDDAGTTELRQVKNSLKGLTLIAPEGIVGIDPQTQHVSKIVRIGKILPSGQFQIVHSTEEAIPPIPFPNYKSEESWIEFLDLMYYGWGNSWSNPGEMK